MRIVYLAAGAGGTYCGACMRDTALARGLAAAGHDVEFLSLYAPVKADHAPPGPCRVFFGGINVYLEQVSGLFRHTPAFLHRLFDASWLLDFVGSRALDTRPEDLGEMTVSVLRGPRGKQRGELKRLVDALTAEKPPDVVNITNSLLSAVAPALKKRLDVPVVCNLQGEDAFVERLGEPYRQQATALIREHAASVDVFIAPGEAYADRMTAFLAVDRARIRVIRPGIDLAPFQGEADRPSDVFRIGYLSRITPEKGIDLLCEAFRLLEANAPGRQELTVAGEAGKLGRRLWEDETRRFDEAGIAQRVTYLGTLDFAQKVAFLKRLSVFSVPSRQSERQAMATLEALASGVPVVMPDSGVYPEILSLTGGGVLTAPDDPHALADALAALRDDPARTRLLAASAVAGAHEHFSDSALAANTAELYEALRHA